MIDGTQLADSRGDVVVIYVYGLMHVFIIFSPIEVWGPFVVLSVD